MGRVGLIMLSLMSLMVAGCTHKLKTIKIEKPYPNPKYIAMKDNMWVLTEPLAVTYYNKYSPSETYPIEVPAGFVMNLASIPDGLRILVGKYHDLDAAAIVHDYLFWVQPCKSEGNGKRIADKLYRDTLKESENVSIVNAWLQWGALKSASRHAWNSNKTVKDSGESRLMPQSYWMRITEETRWAHLKGECCNSQKPLELNLPDEKICMIKPENGE